MEKTSILYIIYPILCGAGVLLYSTGVAQSGSSEKEELEKVARARKSSLNVLSFDGQLSGKAFASFFVADTVHMIADFRDTSVVFDRPSDYNADAQLFLGIKNKAIQGCTVKVSPLREMYFGKRDREYGIWMEVSFVYQYVKTRRWCRFRHWEQLSVRRVRRNGKQELLISGMRLCERPADRDWDHVPDGWQACDGVLDGVLASTVADVSPETTTTLAREKLLRDAQLRRLQDSLDAQNLWLRQQDTLARAERMKEWRDSVALAAKLKRVHESIENDRRMAREDSLKRVADRRRAEREAARLREEAEARRRARAYARWLHRFHPTLSLSLEGGVVADSNGRASTYGYLGNFAVHYDFLRCVGIDAGYRYLFTPGDASVWEAAANAELGDGSTAHTDGSHLQMAYGELHVGTNPHRSFSVQGGFVYGLIFSGPLLPNKLTILPPEGVNKANVYDVRLSIVPSWVKGGRLTFLKEIGSARRIGLLLSGEYLWGRVGARGDTAVGSLPDLSVKKSMVMAGVHWRLI